MKHVDSMKMLIAAVLAAPGAAKVFVAEPLAQQLARFAMAAIGGLEAAEAQARELGAHDQLDVIEELWRRLEESRG